MKRLSCLLIVLLLPSGCVFRDIRPPTPAMSVVVSELEKQIPPDEKYYLIIFGSQTKWKRPKYTHTWATALRVRDRGPHDAPEIEELTISWMPRSLDIKTWSLVTEPGINLDLARTVEAMRETDQTIFMWGPYAMRPGLYEKLRIQKQFLESGTIGYQCVDFTGEAAWRRNGCDCIHAITDADSVFDRKHYHLRRYGASASEFIVRQCFERGLLIRPETTHDWLLEKLQLHRETIERRIYRGWSISADEQLNAPVPNSEEGRSLVPSRF